MLLHAAPPEGVPGLAFLRKSGRDVACWAGAEPLPLSVMHLYTAFFFLSHTHLYSFSAVSRGFCFARFPYSGVCVLSLLLEAGIDLLWREGE